MLTAVVSLAAVVLTTAVFTDGPSMSSRADLPTAAAADPADPVHSSPATTSTNSRGVREGVLRGEGERRQVEEAFAERDDAAAAAAEAEFAVVVGTLTESYQFDERSERVAVLQRALQVLVDGHYGLQTRDAHLAVLTYLGWDPSVVPAVPVVVRTHSVPVGGSSKRCPIYEALALSVGWPAAHVEKLSYVMWRESRCDPRAHNSRYPDDSYGLIQLNMRAHKNWVGPLVDWDFTRLFDPATNLRVGLLLWQKNGWDPWNV